jgi:membrane-bound lytic murein transglycosylase A
MLRFSPRNAASIRAGILGFGLLVAGCSGLFPPPPTPVPQAVPLQPPAHPRARWQPAEWSELPGWTEDALLQAWPALRSGCARPPPGWAELCARVQLEAPESESAARLFLLRYTRPYRVESLEGRADGLITGYYEPLVEARRRRDAQYAVPLYAAPADLAQRQPHWTRRELDTLPEARAALQDRVIAWVRDPLDALLLQIQGSGRLALTEPDGRVRSVRVAYAGHNGHPYRSVGRWLIEQRALTAESASWPAIKAWARANPRRVDEMLWVNPRVVYFREEPLPDPSQGPRGAMGVPLTPGRSIAVDPQSVPYGAWVWIDTTEPLSSTPLRRLVAAQDTGSAITGAVRADFFWGWGEEAEAQAGRMKQPLRLWVLWPADAPV